MGGLQCSSCATPPQDTSNQRPRSPNRTFTLKIILLALEARSTTMSNLLGLIPTVATYCWNVNKRYKDLAKQNPKLRLDADSLYSKLVWTNKFVQGRQSKLNPDHKQQLQTRCEQCSATLEEAEVLANDLNRRGKRAIQALISDTGLETIVQALRDHRDAIDSIVGEMILYVNPVLFIFASTPLSCPLSCKRVASRGAYNLAFETAR